MAAFSGCLFSIPSGGDATTNKSSVGEEPGQTQAVSNVTDYPATASWKDFAFEGNLSFRVIVEPSQPTTCGFVYGAAGSGSGEALGALGWDSLNETGILASFDYPDAEVAGTTGIVTYPGGTWAARNGEIAASVNESFSFTVSGFELEAQSEADIPAVEAIVGCNHAFDLSVWAGSAETTPISGGRWGSGIGASATASVVSAKASVLVDRKFHQEAERTIVVIGQNNLTRQNDLVERGSLEIDTPGRDVSRAFSTKRLDPVHIEAGPGEYHVQAHRVAVQARQLYGSVFGLDPVGDSLADLDAWAHEHAHEPTSTMP